MQSAAKDFSQEQRAGIMAAVRRGAEIGRPVGATARELGITQATFYRWVREEARRAGSGSTPSGTEQVGLVMRQETSCARRRPQPVAKPPRRGRLPVLERRELQERAIALNDRVPRRANCCSALRKLACSGWARI